MPGAPELSRLVARRTATMAALRDHSRTKQELVEALDVSRSTVDRAVRELEQAEFVTRADGGVGLTLSGRLALDSYEKHLAELTTIGDVIPDLDALPQDLDLPAALFRDPTVVTPDRAAPHRPSDVILDLLDGASEVKHYATGIRPEYLEQYWDRVFDGGRLEVVATPDVVAEAVQESPEILKQALDTGNVSLLETEEARPYSFVVADDTDVCVLLYEDHALMAVLRNDNPATACWAVDRFEALQADAKAADRMRPE